MENTNKKYKYQNIEKKHGQIKESLWGKDEVTTERRGNCKLIPFMSFFQKSKYDEIWAFLKPGCYALTFIFKLAISVLSSHEVFCN